MKSNQRILGQHHNQQQEDGDSQHQRAPLSSKFGGIAPILPVDTLGTADEFNLEANLMDLSRISMGQVQDQSIIFDKDPIQDQVNESMVQETLQMMMSESRKNLKTKKIETKPPLKPKKSGTSEHSGSNVQTQLQDKLYTQQQQPNIVQSQVVISQSEPPMISQNKNSNQVLVQKTAQSELKDQNSVGSTEWKKVSITKKRRFTKKNQNESTQAASHPQPLAPLQPSLESEVDLNDIQINIGVPQHSQSINNAFTASTVSKQTKNVIMSKSESKNKYANEAEPLPLFDCLYCIGIHEHLALQTLKEKQLNKVYGTEPSIQKLTTENKDQTYFEFNEEFNENVRHLERMLTINIMEYERIKKQQEKQLLNINELKLGSSRSSAESSPGLRTQQDFKDIISVNTYQKYMPLKSVIDNKLRQISQLKAKKEANKQQIADKQKRNGEANSKQNNDFNSLNSDDSYDSQLASNILGGFNDIDSEEQSMFINLNIRNRRQKILHNISFESEFHDIFNPEYTSDASNSEGTDSRSSEVTSEVVSSSNSGESNSESYSTSNSQVSSKSSSQIGDSLRLDPVPKEGVQRKNIRTKTQSIEHTETRFPDLDGSQAPDRTIDLNKQNKINQTKLKEKDLDYNSENNRSSLSSIHREIQEAPSSQRGRNNRNEINAADDEMETGGCQVEEMQNDTVVNKCNFMLAGKGRLGEDSESFTKQIKREQDSKMKQLMDKQPVPDASICMEERSDPEDLPSSGIDEMAGIQDKQRKIRIQKGGKVASPQAKTTGRFNNFPLTSSDNRSSQVKYQLKKDKNDDRHIFLTQHDGKLSKGVFYHQNDNIEEGLGNGEDDSIIKILPGLPSGEVCPPKLIKGQIPGISSEGFDSGIEKQMNQGKVQGKSGGALAQKLARLHQGTKGDKGGRGHNKKIQNKNLKESGANPLKSQSRDLTGPDLYAEEEASSISSSDANGLRFDHQALNLVLQTSPGNKSSVPEPEMPIMTASSQLQDTDEEDNLLSPILQIEDKQQQVTTQKRGQKQSPSFKKNQQILRKNAGKGDANSPDRTALKAQQPKLTQQMITTSGKKKYQSYSNQGILNNRVWNQMTASALTMTNSKAIMPHNIKNSTQKISMNTRNNFQQQQEQNSNEDLGAKDMTGKLQSIQLSSNMRKSTLMIGAENPNADINNLGLKQIVNPDSEGFYTQMGKKIQKKRASALSKNSTGNANSKGNSSKKLVKVPSSISNQIISASMGSLPGIMNQQMIGDHNIEHGSQIPKCESQAILPNEHIQTQESVKRMSKLGHQPMTVVLSKKKLTIEGATINVDKIAVTSVTPIKQRQNLQNMNQGRQSAVAANQKSIQRQGKSEKQISGKHIRQFATTNIGNQMQKGNKDQSQANSKSGTYGMLSKQQLKLMKQLEKQQQQQNSNVGSRNQFSNQQTRKFEVSNAKNVIDNYFKVNPDENNKVQATKNFQSATQVLKIQGNNKQKNISDDRIAQIKRFSQVPSPSNKQNKNIDIQAIDQILGQNTMISKNLQRYISGKQLSKSKNPTPSQHHQADINTLKYQSSIMDQELGYKNIDIPSDKQLSLVQQRKSGEYLASLVTQKSTDKRNNDLFKLSQSPSHKVKKIAGSNVKQISQSNVIPGNVVVPNLNLLTLEYQQQKTGTNQPMLEISGEEDYNQDNNVNPKIHKPVEQTRYSKFKKFQSVKSYQHSTKHSLHELNSKTTIVQMKPVNYNTKVISQNDYSDSKSNYNIHATLSHISSSQLEHKHNATYNDTGLQNLHKKLDQKLANTNLESNIFNDDNTNFSMPAQSQRTRVSINKLSISADKTPKPQNKDLLKTTIELGANNFSQIQAEKTGGVYSCIENNNITKNQGNKSSQPSNTIYSSNQKVQEVSKQSIEREILQNWFKKKYKS